MRAEEFAGVIAPWKVRLVVSRVKRRGVRGADLDEVVQRILIELLDFEYCESRSNGATEATAITALVDRQVAYYRRGEMRHRAGIDAAMPEEPSIDNRHTVDTAMDLHDAMAQLPEFARQVCEALSNERSINEIAKQLNVSWHTVRDQVQVLRGHFVRLGLAPVAKRAKQETAA